MSEQISLQEVNQLSEDQQLELAKQEQQNKKAKAKNQANKSKNNQKSKNSQSKNKQSKNPPSKIVLRPVAIKHIEQIHRMYLQQKTPTQIQKILKEPTLAQIEFILKEKISIFLNIIFQSSHCYTQEQIQKLQPQIDKKIQKISTKMMNPLSNNFIDTYRYKNFLKLMKYHKQGRRSQKISHQCNSFFRLFFLKMKFQGVSHTLGNIIELNQSDEKIEKPKNSKNNKSNKQFDQYSQNSQSSSSGEQYGDENKKKRNSKNASKNLQISSVSGNNNKKKYNYPKQLMVSQQMMDETYEQLMKQIKQRLRNKQLLQEINKTMPIQLQNDPKNPSKNLKIQWTFDIQNTLLNSLHESYYVQDKPVKSLIKLIKLLSSKYEVISQKHLNFQKIQKKVQSMYIICIQKYIRRIKYIISNQTQLIQENKKQRQAIQEQLQNNQNGQIQSQSPKINIINPVKKNAFFSNFQNQNSQSKNDIAKSFLRQDDYYFTKLKQKLKKIDLRSVYFSSNQQQVYHEQWQFMLKFIKDFYFSNLQTMKFEYLMSYIPILNSFSQKRNRKITLRSQINIQQHSDEQQSNNNEIISQNKNKQKNNINNIQLLLKSSLAFTLNKMRNKKQTNQINFIQSLQMFKQPQIQKLSPFITTKNQSIINIKSQPIQQIHNQNHHIKKIVKTDLQNKKNYKRQLKINQKNNHDHNNKKIIQKQFIKEVQNIKPIINKKTPTPQYKTQQNKLKRSLIQQLSDLEQANQNQNPKKAIKGQNNKIIIQPNRNNGNNKINRQNNSNSLMRKNNNRSLPQSSYQSGQGVCQTHQDQYIQEQNKQTQDQNHQKQSEHQSQYQTYNLDQSIQKVKNTKNNARKPQQFANNHHNQYQQNNQQNEDEQNSQNDQINNQDHVDYENKTFDQFQKYQHSQQGDKKQLKNSRFNKQNEKMKNQNQILSESKCKVVDIEQNDDYDVIKQELKKIKSKNNQNESNSKKQKEQKVTEIQKKKIIKKTKK